MLHYLSLHTPKIGVQEPLMLTVTRGEYSEDDVIIMPISNPDDEIALQFSRLYPISLSTSPEFDDDVDFHAAIGGIQTRKYTNLTIIDDDGMVKTLSLVSKELPLPSTVKQHVSIPCIYSCDCQF